MVRVRAPWCVAGMLFLFAGCASTPPGPSFGEGLPNFAAVDAHLYRGAQPLPGGFAELHEKGVRTLIDLRGLQEQPPTRDAEKKATEGAQIEYIPKPMPGLGAPDRKAVEDVLSVITTRTAPVFLHCKRGADRTGTVVAIYRITHDCWTADRAIQEAREHGMWWGEFGMRRFIRDWYEEIKAKGNCTPAGERGAGVEASRE